MKKKKPEKTEPKPKAATAWGWPLDPEAMTREIVRHNRRTLAVCVGVREAELTVYAEEDQIIIGGGKIARKLAHSWVGAAQNLCAVLEGGAPPWSPAPVEGAA